MTIGYVVGGFVIKFHLNYLDTEIVYILDHMTLDILPLGSTLMFLIYSLMPLLLLYTIVGGVSFILLVRRTRVLLITVSSGSLLIYSENNSSFVWPEDGSVARSRRLKATDAFEGQTKLLLSEKPVYNCFVIHHHFLKIIHVFHSHISIRCFKYTRPSSPRIGATFWHCYVNITWLREPMKIRPSVNSNRSMNCWPVNRSVLQLVGILLLTANCKMLCIYCIGFILEKKWWCISKPVFSDYINTS